MGKRIRLDPLWRVAFVDDSRSTLEACSTLLSVMAAFECVGTYVDGKQAIESFTRSKPDIVLVDLRMPGLNGLEVTRLLLEIHPTVKIIILTAFADLENVWEAIRLGVAGFLTKPVSADEFRDALNSAAHGTVCLGSGVRSLLVSPASEGAGVEPDYASLLTPRELELLRLIAMGKQYKEAAAQLSISERTVNSHLVNIRTKLGVNNSIEAINRVFLREVPLPVTS